MDNTLIYKLLESDNIDDQLVGANLFITRNDNWNHILFDDWFYKDISKFWKYHDLIRRERELHILNHFNMKEKIMKLIYSSNKEDIMLGIELSKDIADFWDDSVKTKGYGIGFLLSQYRRKLGVKETYEWDKLDIVIIQPPKGTKTHISPDPLITEYENDLLIFYVYNLYRIKNLLK